MSAETPEGRARLVAAMREARCEFRAEHRGLKDKWWFAVAFGEREWREVFVPDAIVAALGEAGTPPRAPDAPPEARIFPCDKCEKLRSKDEGGTVFTVCDECWDASRPEVVTPDATEAAGRTPVSTTMQGTRLPDLPVGEHFPILNPGEYRRHHDGTWYGATPNGLLSNLAGHRVVEHDDGTITVAPSILTTGHDGDGISVTDGVVWWHGYLERGVWREV